MFNMANQRKSSIQLPGGILVEVTVADNAGGHCMSNLYKDKHTTRKEADVLESLILGHACAGVDVTSEAYKEGLLTTIYALGNHS